jgi:hypothetical protein
MSQDGNSGYWDMVKRLPSQAKDGHDVRIGFSALGLAIGLLVNPDDLKKALAANLQSIAGAVRVAPWAVPPLSGKPEDQVLYQASIQETFGQLPDRDSVLPPQAAPAARDLKL